MIAGENQTLHQHIVRYFSYFCTTSKKINEHCSASVKLPFIPNELKIKKNKIDRKIVTPFQQFTVQSTINTHKCFSLVIQTDFREVNSMTLKSIWERIIRQSFYTISKTFKNVRDSISFIYK